MGLASGGAHVPLICIQEVGREVLDEAADERGGGPLVQPDCTPMYDLRDAAHIVTEVNRTVAFIAVAVVAAQSTWQWHATGDASLASGQLPVGVAGDQANVAEIAILKLGGDRAARMY